MRKILFRGKRLSDGGWSYGNLRIANTGVAIIVPNDTPLGKYGKVDPETVGQFTGLTDMNGVKIFEGDVVETRDFRKYKICMGECCPNVWKNWCENHFVKKERPIIAVYAKALESGNEAFVPIDNVCKVIGNIFDNPELMKGEIDEDSNRR